MDVSRRDFIRLGTAAVAATAASRLVLPDLAVARARPAPAAVLEEATIAELQAAMDAGRLTALSLVRMYLARIEALDRNGPRLNSILEVNPDAEAIAKRLDRERRMGFVRGPLHGIPIVLKDNIDTADRMQTAAGSLALVGAPPQEDATVVANLRRGGAIILGKTNLSEWANFRSFFSSSGWSGRAGQCHNPYVLDRNPCGSSSGSAIAPSANLTAAALGTETDGSIVCPATACGVVGLKPTVGLTSRAGVVPIAFSQDTVGPFGRTVEDAAVVLGIMASREPDDRDPATAPNRGKVFRDYTRFIDPQGLEGARIGVARQGLSGFTEETEAVFEEAIAAMQAAGATVVDPADIDTIDRINRFQEEIAVLVFEFKRDLNAYLATRSDVALDREGFDRTLGGLIDFNLAHAEEELKWFGQEWFELAEGDPFSEEEYLAALSEARRIGGPEGIDATLAKHDLDAIVAPTGAPAWTTDLVNGDHFLGGSSSPAAIAGYPLISVPAGAAFGLPVGLTFMGTAFSEPTLIRVASGFEAATRARRRPQFQETLPLDGTELDRGRGQARMPSATRPVVGQL